MMIPALKVSGSHGDSNPVNGLALSADGRLAVSASKDTTLKIWEVENGRELRTLQGHTNVVYGVAMSADGRLAVSASEDKTLKVWRVGESGRELRTLRGHSLAVESVAASQHGSLAVSGSWDGTLKVWEVGERAGTARIEGRYFPTRPLFAALWRSDDWGRAACSLRICGHIEGVGGGDRTGTLHPPRAFW